MDRAMLKTLALELNAALPPMPQRGTDIDGKDELRAHADNLDALIDVLQLASGCGSDIKGGTLVSLTGLMRDQLAAMVRICALEPARAGVN